MSCSSLCNGKALTDKCNSRNGNQICRITPHQMIAHWTGQTAATWFRDNGCENSVNYCIGYDGSIWQNVDEDYRAWTSSSAANDRLAITVELSNNENIHSGQMTDATIEAFINLCVDLIKRYPGLGGKFNYTGNTSGNITLHEWFAATDCPGAWFKAKLPYIQSQVNSRLGSGVTKPVSRDCSRDQVKVLVNDLNVRKGAGTNYAVLGYAQKGKWYNVLDKKLVNKTMWWRIAKNQWIAHSEGQYTHYVVGGVYKDVNTNYKYYKEIAWCNEQKLVNPKNKKFGLGKATTRVYLAVLLWRLSGKPSVTVNLPVTDCNDLSVTQKKAVQWCINNGILNPYKNKTWRPSNTVKKKVFAVALWRLAGKKEPSKDYGWSDLRSESSTVKKAANWNKQKGLIGGSDKLYKPNTTVTRQFANVFVYRYAKKILKK